MGVTSHRKGLAMSNSGIAMKPLPAMVGEGWVIGWITPAHRIIILVKPDGTKFSSREEAEERIALLTKDEEVSDG